MNSKKIFNLFFVVSAFVLLSGCGSDSTATFVVKSGVKAARFFKVTDYLNFSRAIIGGTPTRFDATFYAAYLSESADCAAPFVEVADHRPDGLTMDVTTGPTVFEASPAAATYNCLIMEVSDVFTFRPDATAQTANSACSTSADSVFDIHREDENDWVTKEGDAIVGAGTVPSPLESSDPNKGVTVFVSTDAAAVTGASPNQVLDLASALTITTDTTTITMYNDITNKISINTESMTDYCWMEPGTMTLE